MTVTVTNTDTMTRYWPRIPDPGTGRPLTLEPGESADIDDLPDDFEDPYLTVSPQQNAPIVPPPVPSPPAATEPAASEEE
jgi:hypothetical protein